MIFYLIQRITWIVCNLISGFFLHKKISGQENVGQLNRGGVIFIANHGGKWDPFLIGSSVPKKYFKKMNGLRIMTFPKYTDSKWYKFYIRFVGAYPIYRNGGDYKKSLAETIEILKANYSLVMFPTGGIDKDFKLEKTRPGVAYLAQELNPLFMPVFVTDSNKITLRQFLLRQRRVKVIFGPAFYYTDVAENNGSFLEMAKKIMEPVGQLALSAEDGQGAQAVKLSKAARPA